MRFVIRAIIPTETGNKMVKDPNFISNMENYIKANKAEAAYFLELNGDRTAVFVLDLPSVDMIPAVAEPLFMLGAKVELHPAMTIDDLKKGIALAIGKQ
ncbi:hypothetical protein NTE_02472 [Candidatus Nitrososphaera evergladensis SR1]|jgi:hypothetical protein|uniref:Uncharacterized protein n=1 Tax=Candidatus Nitrososphaera evergladensis SR1 TaxID=1459636 RepID=A0A075MSG3_9ARCH|nr:hypothetical protein [Candidatus Nitrososphaera evergladensis]AIF84521.1 hypothetical protein NTE_02472 [Candidatus Nitrososphaera evergladensis SR1]